MSVQRLEEQAGLRIPLNALFFATEPQGKVINEVFLDSVRIHPKLGHQDLRAMCTVCKKDGDCLCYLFLIRHMMIDSYWGSEMDHQHLCDWVTLPNHHA